MVDDTPRPLYSGEKIGIHLTGDWLGPPEPDWTVLEKPLCLKWWRESGRRGCCSWCYGTQENIQHHYWKSTPIHFVHNLMTDPWLHHGLTGSRILQMKWSSDWEYCLLSDPILNFPQPFTCVTRTDPVPETSSLRNKSGQLSPAQIYCISPKCNTSEPSGVNKPLADPTARGG